MKPTFSALFLVIFGLILFQSCEKNEIIEEEIPDTFAPTLKRVAWIYNPYYEGPTGDIEDGENYSITIDNGFHLIYLISDESNLESVDSYFLVNNDPNLRETIVNKDLILDYKEGTFGFVQRATKFTSIDGEIYSFQPGDKLYFYLTAIDEFNNSVSMEWTADLQ